MNCLPLNFYDEVIQRLSKDDIGRLKLTSTWWSSTAETHFNRRRDLAVYLKSNYEGTKVDVRLEKGVRKVPFEIDFKYDRIIFILFNECWYDKTVEETLPIEHFRTKTLPLIRSVARDCRLSASGSQQNLCDIVFDGLKKCSGLSHIFVKNRGEKSHEFIRRQIKLGSLLRLSLLGNITFGQDLDTNWPADFQDSIKVFVKSPNFSYLDIRYSNLGLDMDMVTCVFDRFFRGELTFFVLTGRPSFPLEDLRSLYRDFAAIPEDWPSQESTAVWKVTLRDRKLEVTVPYGRKIEIRGHCLM